MPSEDLLHTINNQLAVVMGRAELMAYLAKDQKTRESCAEIEGAVQRIMALLDRAQLGSLGIQPRP